jgi:hypothetical protein
MQSLTLSIAEEFSRYPAGRTRRDGENSAQRFRDDYLIPSLRKAVAHDARLVVKLDGVFGYSSSFLEETFGGLVRSRAFDPDIIERTLVIEAQNPIYASTKIDAQKYLADEMRRVPA